MRVCFLLFIALVVPQFFFHDEKAVMVHRAGSAGLELETFKLGIENISHEFLQSLSKQGSINAYTVGLITNHTGLDQQGKRNIDILLTKGLRIKKIYVPEDDFFAYKRGDDWEMIDDHTSIPIAMLAHIDSLKKSKEYTFADVDVLFVDLQDPGISPNTYLATLVKTLQSAASQNKTVVVLDRPNILGASMEGITNDTGSTQREEALLPMRYGMTFGELARYFNTNVLSKSARLFVVPMQKYNRTLIADAHISSHGSLLTNIDTYYGSSFLTILSSVAPFDIGLGTDMAFQCLALPESLHFSKKKWFELRTVLKEHGIETSWFRYRNPKKRMQYSGLRLLVRHVDQFSPFNTVVTVVNFFKDAGVTLSFSSEFDRVFGGKKMRDFLEGKFSRHDLEYEVNKGLKNFFNKAQHSFIYKPLPKIVLM